MDFKDEVYRSSDKVGLKMEKDKSYNMTRLYIPKLSHISVLNILLTWKFSIATLISLTVFYIILFYIAENF